MTRFYLIRHATNDTVSRWLPGRMAGVSLNREGRDQAERLAKQLQHVPLTAVYSSPLERAVETAAPIAGSHGVETVLHSDFNEIDFGEWTGCTFDELREQHRFQLFNTFRSITRVPGGELMVEAQARMIKGLEKLCASHDNETVAIVSHADMIRAAITFYAGIHLDLLQRIEISPASVSILEMSPDYVKIVCINSTL